MPQAQLVENTTKFWSNILNFSSLVISISHLVYFSWVFQYPSTCMRLCKKVFEWSRGHSHLCEIATFFYNTILWDKQKATPQWKPASGLNHLLCNCLHDSRISLLKRQISTCRRIFHHLFEREQMHAWMHTWGFLLWRKKKWRIKPIWNWEKSFERLFKESANPKGHWRSGRSV